MKISVFRFFLFVLGLTLSSCEVEPEDVKSPEINLSVNTGSQSVATGSIVKKTISFVCEVDEKVTFVLSVDGSAVYELQNATSLNYDFDTKTLAEGPHEFKIAVADLKGNTSETSFSVIVRNVLLDLAYNPGTFTSGPGVRYFVILSDVNGNVIAHKELIDGAVLFEYPDNYDEDYVTVTTLEESERGGNSPFYFAYTYANVRQGQYRYATYPPRIPTGVHTVSCPNLDGYDFIFSDDNVVSATAGDGSRVKLELAAEDVDVYMFRNAAMGRNYKLLENVKSGGTTIFDSEQIAAMPVHTTHSLPASTGNVMSIVTGIKQSGKRITASYFISENKADILYPAELYKNYFKDFKTVVERFEQDGNFKAWTSTSGPNDDRGFLKSIDPFNASLTGVLSDVYPNISISTTGNIDFKRLDLESTDKSKSWYWKVLLQDQSIKLPVIPLEVINALKDKVVPPMKLLDVSLVDANVEQDYQWFITGFLQRSDLGDINEKSKYYNLRPEPSGGRKPDQKNKHPESVNDLSRKWLN